MALKRLYTGQRITRFPNVTWNAMADNAELVGDENRVAAPPLERSFVRVRLNNTTGQHVPAGGVLRVGDPVFDVNVGSKGLDGLPIFSGDSPDPAEQFAIATQPISIGTMGRGSILGLVWARVDILNASHDSVTPASSITDHLVSGFDGVPIRWKPTGTGVKLCVIELGAVQPITIRTVKPDSAITSGNSGTCSIHDQNGDTGTNMTVGLKWADGGSQISGGKEAFAAKVQGWDDWLFIGAECE